MLVYFELLIVFYFEENLLIYRTTPYGMFTESKVHFRITVLPALYFRHLTISLAGSNFRLSVCIELMSRCVVDPVSCRRVGRVYNRIRLIKVCLRSGIMYVEGYDKNRLIMT